MGVRFDDATPTALAIYGFWPTSPYAKSEAMKPELFSLVGRQLESPEPYGEPSPHFSVSVGPERSESSSPAKQAV